jgi:hypothetical protein
VGTLARGDGLGVIAARKKMTRVWGEGTDVDGQR